MLAAYLSVSLRSLCRFATGCRVNTFGYFEPKLINSVSKLVQYAIGLGCKRKG